MRLAASRTDDVHPTSTSCIRAAIRDAGAAERCEGGTRTPVWFCTPRGCWDDLTLVCQRSASKRYPRSGAHQSSAWDRESRGRCRRRLGAACPGETGNTRGVAGRLLAKRHQKAHHKKVPPARLGIASSRRQPRRARQGARVRALATGGAPCASPSCAPACVCPAGFALERGVLAHVTEGGRRHAPPFAVPVTTKRVRSAERSHVVKER
jgi:hypothetical protein